VTQGGNEQLEERLVIRPTSERSSGRCTEVGSLLARSPILINQWANVVRGEVTRLFLRTTEFLWQGAHRHETAEEAQEETLKMLGVYKDFAETELAMPVVDGQNRERKVRRRRATYSIEALMRDAARCRPHVAHLGQNFAKVFDISSRRATSPFSTCTGRHGAFRRA